MIKGRSLIRLMALFTALAVSPCVFGGEGTRGALLYAIANSNCAGILRALENGEDVSSRDKIGATPLMRAVENNLHPECIRPLLHAGADPNATHGSEEISVLMIAASYSTAETVSLLVQSGANVEFATPDGWTALMSAARNSSQPAVIGALVAAGADINTVDHDGVTALMRAAQTNPHPEIIQALVQRGADLIVKSSSGHTAYKFAIESGHSREVLEILQPNSSNDAQGN